jgi:hypothetical protein
MEKIADQIVIKELNSKFPKQTSSKVFSLKINCKDNLNIKNKME